MIERYLLLGLRLGRHVDGYVDAYYGPPELAEQAAAEELVPAAELAAEAATLRDEAASLEDHARRRWLEAQLLGAETAARRLAGEPIGYVDEVERCFGVRPERTPEERFAEAHELLDEALPGEGTLFERYQAWLDTQIVPAGSLSEAIALFKDELRKRTRELVELPDGEEVESELVSNEPWGGFNYYLGGRRSRSVVNTDLPTRAYLVPELVAHEMYPGHHTEHACKEALLVDGLGHLEETLLLVPTPQSLVSEGIATNAIDLVLDGDRDEWSAALLRPLGIDYDVETTRVARETFRTLGFVSANNALMIHDEGAPLDEAREYYRRWALANDRRVEKHLEFVTDPTWRSYVFNYTAGEQLVRDWVAGDRKRFRRLLTEQLTPADLQ